MQGPLRPCGKPWAMCGNARLNIGDERQCLQIFVFGPAIIISNYIHLLMVLLCLPFKHRCHVLVSPFTCCGRNFIIIAPLLCWEFHDRLKPTLYSQCPCLSRPRGFAGAHERILKRVGFDFGPCITLEGSPRDVMVHDLGNFTVDPHLLHECSPKCKRWSGRDKAYSSCTDRAREVPSRAIRRMSP